MSFRFRFKAKVKDGDWYSPKGFYYQGKYIILVFDDNKGHTIMMSCLVEDVQLEIINQL